MAKPALDPVPDDIATSQASVRGWYGCIMAALAFALPVPIWIVDYPPLVDYPNHLARGYILYHYDDVPSFAEHFEIDWWTPSLAMDLFMVAAQPIGDVRVAGKLFLTITLWLWLGGWHLLGSAIHGKPTWLALGAALVAYHSMFLYGFTNFSFGLSVFLVATAAWLHWRATWIWWRFLDAMFLALACYFSHLSAFIFLYGTVAALTFWDLLKQKRGFRQAIRDMLPVNMAMVVPVVAILRGGASSGGFEWNTLAGKLVGALCLFRGYHRHADAALIAAVAIFLILLGAWALRIQVNGGVLFAGLGSVFMFLIGPREIFGGSPADARFLPPAAALVVLSLDLSLPRKKALVLLGVLLALVCFRLGTIGLVWHSFDAALREQTALFESLPAQAKVYPMVQVSEQPEEQKLDLASFHMIHYAVIDRHIYSPHLLAYSGQQPIRYRTPPSAYHTAQDGLPSLTAVNWDKVFASYDYIWGWKLPEIYRAFLQRHCTLVAASGHATLWRVQHVPQVP